MWFGSRYSFFPLLFSCGMQKGIVLVASHIYSAGSGDRRGKVSVHPAPFLFRAHPACFSRTVDCSAVWTAAPSGWLCVEQLWILINVFPNNKKHFLRHFIMVDLKRPLCSLHLNVDFLAHLEFLQNQAPSLHWALLQYQNVNCLERRQKKTEDWCLWC